MGEASLEAHAWHGELRATERLMRGRRGLNGTYGASITETYSGAAPSMSRAGPVETAERGRSKAFDGSSGYDRERYPRSSQPKFGEVNNVLAFGFSW